MFKYFALTLVAFFILSSQSSQDIHGITRINLELIKSRHLLVFTLPLYWDSYFIVECSHEVEWAMTCIGGTGNECGCCWREWYLRQMEEEKAKEHERLDVRELPSETPRCWEEYLGRGPGFRLHWDLPLAFLQSVLGAEFEVATSYTAEQISSILLSQSFPFRLTVIPKSSNRLKSLALLPLHCPHVFISLLLGLNTIVIAITSWVFLDLPAHLGKQNPGWTQLVD